LVPVITHHWREILGLYLKRLLDEGVLFLWQDWRFGYSDLKEAAPGLAMAMGFRSGCAVDDVE
jgi:hypothetical protein